MAVQMKPAGIEAKVKVAQQLAEHVLVVAEMAITDRERADRELEGLVSENPEYETQIRTSYSGYLVELGIVSTDVAG